MLKFSEPALIYKPQADAIFYSGNCRSNDYCFGNIFIWRKKYQTEVAFQDHLISVRFRAGNQTAYLYPVGEGDVSAAIRAMATDAEKIGERFLLAGVTPRAAQSIEKLFPGKFIFSPNRDLFDYLYLSADLIGLRGKKYHSKRNHVTRFKLSGEWRYEPITQDNLRECAEMNEEWFAVNNEENSGGLQEEYDAIQEAFRNYPALGFIGGLLRLEGRVVAYTFGEKLCRDTFDIHVEKAFADVEGAYAAINHEFAAQSCADYQYINREEDVGDEGLRKSKLSYHPALLLEKSLALLKEGEAL